MELMEVIKNRRSVREYTSAPLDRETIEKLLEAAVHAPSGMNIQNWAFGVITDPARLKDYSDKVKAELMKHVDEWEWLSRYKEMISDPNYHVFYHAPALVVIYSKSFGTLGEINCCLAAENLMLAACDMGLGTCWIGFATELLNQPEMKKELGVPEEYTAVAPIIVGHPAGDVPEVPRNAPEVLFMI